MIYEGQVIPKAHVLFSRIKRISAVFEQFTYFAMKTFSKLFKVENIHVYTIWIGSLALSNSLKYFVQHITLTPQNK